MYVINIQLMLVLDCKTSRRVTLYFDHPSDLQKFYTVLNRVCFPSDGDLPRNLGETLFAFEYAKTHPMVSIETHQVT